MSFRFLDNQEKALFLPLCRFMDIKTRRKCVVISWTADLPVSVEMHLFIPIISYKEALLFGSFYRRIVASESLLYPSLYNAKLIFFSFPSLSRRDPRVSRNG